MFHPTHGAWYILLMSMVAMRCLTAAATKCNYSKKRCIEESANRTEEWYKQCFEDDSLALETENNIKSCLSPCHPETGQMRKCADYCPDFQFYGECVATDPPPAPAPSPAQPPAQPPASNSNLKKEIVYRNVTVKEEPSPQIYLMFWTVCVLDFILFIMCTALLVKQRRPRGGSGSRFNRAEGEGRELEDLESAFRQGANGPTVLLQSDTFGPRESGYSSRVTLQN